MRHLAISLQRADTAAVRVAVVASHARGAVVGFLVVLRAHAAIRAVPSVAAHALAPEVVVARDADCISGAVCGCGAIEEAVREADEATLARAAVVAVRVLFRADIAC